MNPVLPNAYPFLTQKFWSYYQFLRDSNPSHRLIRVVQERGERQAFQPINELFRITSQNTKLEPDKLLNHLGLDLRNHAEDHLQAIFGVMRAVNTLAAIGFTNMTPLLPQESRRECDLLAEYSGIRFAVEVFRSSETAYRFPEHSLPRHNLENYISQRYINKRSQFQATMDAYNCKKGLLAVVMDSQPAKALSGLYAVAKEAFEQMGNPNDLHLLIFNGVSDIHGKDERAIYPKLPH